jgi:hypothetical protein
MKQQARSKRPDERPWVQSARCWILAAVLATSGCALVTSPGDIHLGEREFLAARDAYLLVLENRQSGRRVESALYNLGLLYLQPDPELNDPVAADAVLTRLTYIRPRSPYAAKAALLLELNRSTLDLRLELEAQRVQALEAEQRLSSLLQTATETEARSEDQTKKVGQLGSRITGLQGQIIKLREELAATDAELTAREDELERLKKIDLEEPQ